MKYFVFSSKKGTLQDFFQFSMCGKTITEAIQTFIRKKYGLHFIPNGFVDTFIQNHDIRTCSKKEYERLAHHFRHGVLPNIQ